MYMCACVYMYILYMCIACMYIHCTCGLLSVYIDVSLLTQQSHQGHSQGDIVAGEDTLTDAAMMKKMKYIYH